MAVLAFKIYWPRQLSAQSFACKTLSLLIALIIIRPVLVREFRHLLCQTIGLLMLPPLFRPTSFKAVTPAVETVVVSSHQTQVRVTRLADTASPICIQNMFSFNTRLPGTPAVKTVVLPPHSVGRQWGAPTIIFSLRQLRNDAPFPNSCKQARDLLHRPVTCWQKNSSPWLVIYYTGPWPVDSSPWLDVLTSPCLVH